MSLVLNTSSVTVKEIEEYVPRNFTIYGDKGEILRFEGNGDIFIHGKLIENDKQVVDGFREILNQKGL